MSNQSFFEAMGIAGLERIHTQMLYWIIDNENIDIEVRSNIINSIFKKNDNIIYNKIYCMTEFNSIDFLVRADNYLFVLENKVASSQHDAQLMKYVEVIGENINKQTEGVFFPGIKSIDDVSFRLLSLINEKPEDDRWDGITYEELCKIFKKFQDKLTDKNNSSVHFFIKDYVDSLSYMVEIFDRFKKSFKEFKCAFKKERKDIKYGKLHNLNNSYNEYEKYVAMQNLETIFQKYFFTYVGKKMNKGLFRLSESHGSALIEFAIKKVPNYGKQHIGYMFGIQFQNNSVKLNFRPVDITEYNKSSFTDLTPQIINDFKAAFNDIRESGDYLGSIKFNNNNKKAYISISFKRKKDILTMNTYDDVVDCFNKEYNLLKKYVEKYFKSF